MSSSSPTFRSLVRSSAKTRHRFPLRKLIEILITAAFNAFGFNLHKLFFDFIGLVDFGNAILFQTLGVVLDV